MGFGRGALLWLLGVPLPIIMLLALFWHRFCAIQKINLKLTSSVD